MARALLRGLIDELREEGISIAGEEGDAPMVRSCGWLVGEEIEGERVDVAAEAGARSGAGSWRPVGGGGSSGSAFLMRRRGRSGRGRGREGASRR